MSSTEHLSILPRLAGRRVLVLNWRDIHHPQAGGAEQYMHQIARRWVAAGVRVTWCTARAPGQSAAETIDGIRIVRAGGDLSLYLHAAALMVRNRDAYDAVVDCQNGIPFFSPVFNGAAMPVVQVVHHVHQDQFDTKFPRPVAAVGRMLEGPVARRVYGPRAIAAVSPSTRRELRRRLGFTGPIHVVPNGASELPDRTPTARYADPTIVVVSRLVPHKRIDLLLHHVQAAQERVAGLRVEVIGGGPELPRMRQLVTDLGMHPSVTVHGYQPDAVRDALLRRAWITTSTSSAEGWGCSVIEAAASGVPCVALDVPGIRDSVVDGTTGWLVGPKADYATAVVDALTELADPGRAEVMAASCRSWAGQFSWDRSAELLAGVLVRQISDATVMVGGRRRRRIAERRVARSDMSAVATFVGVPDPDLRSALRPTDEVVVRDGRVSVLLGGCDEFDAVAVMHRLGVTHAAVRLARDEDLLAGPDALADGTRRLHAVASKP